MIIKFYYCKNTFFLKDLYYKICLCQQTLETIIILLMEMYCKAIHLTP